MKLPKSIKPKASLIDKSLLEEEEGNGPYCFGKKMIDRDIILVCLNCGAEENSFS